MRFEIVVVLLILTFSSCERLRQIRPEIERRPSEMPDDTTNRTTIRTNRTENITETPEERTNRTEEITNRTEEIVTPIEPEDETNRTGFRNLLNTNMTEPNRSILVGAVEDQTKLWWEGPLIPKAFFSEELRVIPPQYWVNLNNVIGIVLRSYNGRNALACTSSGNVTMLPISPNRADHIWFPEIVAENIIRLRSFYGGYLGYDPSDWSLSCRMRNKSFLTRWNTYINRDPANQCFYLQALNGVVGITSNNKPDLRPISELEFSSPNDYCWIGDPKALEQWRTGNTYVYSFDTSLLQSIAGKLIPYRGGLIPPTPEPSPEPTPTPSEETPTVMVEPPRRPRRT